MFATILAAAKTLYLSPLSNHQKLAVTHRVLSHYDHHLSIEDRYKASDIIQESLQDYNSKIPQF